jgi:HEPN domain-containing protein
MAEPTLTPEGYAKEWLAYAEMDLSTAEFLLGMYPLLIDTCKQFIPEIITVSEQCAELNPFSSQPRYPRELLINERDMKTAIENAKTVYAFTKPYIAST